ncbi:MULTISPECIES: superoxide dismutase family protein [unclassified Chryseobacterium]|uniref:superoxide dismutase family protein n=1 Tax=unclassified Chryseobacterium TaxID=2593645 RepID=UPI001159F6B8|nr:superoxide dismutase family protein [Chryseobacterium sp. ON_d1]GEJ45006.1 superoxide dismutase [Cu-Zn] [Chryseobacterium sp. ON_d1]
MKVQTLALLAGCAFLAASCGTTKTYSVNAKSGTQTGGTAKFTQNGNEVTMKLDITNLTPGIHAVHIHEKGDCSAADGTSTGGHWNPSKNDHGKWGAEHFHMGDIGNLVADQSGTATLTFKTDKWCLGCTDESKNIIGKGLIVHAAADDFHTQPTGNAGGRVGCVEIK